MVGSLVATPAESATLVAVDVVGIDDHELPSISIVSAGAVVSTHLGPAIVILKSVRMVSSRWHFHSFIRPDGTFCNIVDDRSMVVDDNTS
jgi:hypothetical protein